MVDIRQNSIPSNESIHVLHIASGDLWAGAEVMLYTLAKTLYKELNTQVSIVLLNHGILEQRLLNCGVSVHVLDESRLSSYKILQRLNKIIVELKPDIIHTHRTKEHIIGSIAALYNHRIPSLRTVHGASEHSPSWYQFSKYMILSLNWFCGQFLQKKVISVSDDLAKKLRKQFSANKIQVIENGVDVENILTDRQNHTKAFTKSNRVKIGLIGRLVPVKRVDIFIRTAHIIQHQHQKLNFVFYIFGDGPLRDELESLSHELNTDCIVRFEGHVDNIIEEIQKLDILLMTSDHEGLPMVLLEAMAINTPIISHSVGGIPKLFDYGRCGILVNEHTPSGYAKAILKLVNTPQLAQEMTTSAFERVKNDYSADNNASAYKSVYQSLIQHHTD